VCPWEAQITGKTKETTKGTSTGEREGENKKQGRGYGWRNSSLEDAKIGWRCTQEGVITNAMAEKKGGNGKIKVRVSRVE